MQVRLLIYLTAMLPILWLQPLHTKAQEMGASPVCYTHYLGVGSVNILDTYLSPYAFDGTEIAGSTTTYRPLRTRRSRAKQEDAHLSGTKDYSRWTIASRYGINLARAFSPTKDYKYYDAALSASASIRRKWDVSKAFRLEVGPQAELGLGGTYKSSGGNNPASARALVGLGLSAAAIYSLQIKNRPYRAMLCVDIPLLSVQFTPRYGESYYEIFELEHHKHVVRMATIGNAPSMYLTAGISIPLKSASIVMGYEADVRQSHLSGIKYHKWGNAFILGWSRNLFIQRR